MEHELTGCYPIILDGNETGRLTVSREGLFWHFEAECTLREELLRLSVYGEGSEGYLGVMEPRDGMLRLSKKLSRSGVDCFPTAISYATRAGEAPPMLTCVEEEPAGEEEQQKEDEPCDELPQEDDKPPPEVCDTPLSEQASVTDAEACDDCPTDGFAEPLGERTEVHPCLEELGNWKHCPNPCSLFADLGAKSICAGISGALMRVADDGVILAVPAAVAGALPENKILIFSETEMISGRAYCLANVKYR